MQLKGTRYYLKADLATKGYTLTQRVTLKLKGTLYYSKGDLATNGSPVLPNCVFVTKSYTVLQRG